MKFQPEHAEGVNVVSRHAQGCIWINAQAFQCSMVVPWQGDAQPWGAGDVSELTSEHFERLLAFHPELVVFGSGSRLRFVSPSLTRALYEQRIGVETMDSAAACRTFNVLAGEGRRVVAALILETTGDGQPS